MKQFGERLVNLPPARDDRDDRRRRRRRREGRTIVNEDYSWDRSGPRIREITRLERSLGMLRAQDPPAPLRLPASSAAPAPSAASATSVTAATSVLRDGIDREHASRPARAAVRVAVRGRRRDAGPGGRHAVVVGQSLRTASVVADLTSRRHAAGVVAGHVRTYRSAPGWRMARNRRSGARAHQGGAHRSRRRGTGLAGRPDEHAPRHHRLRLERGALQALILAPPGQFHVETPAAVATDLGCAYRIAVDERGDSELRVTSGWVSLDRPADQVSSWTSSSSSTSTTPSSFVRSGALSREARHGAADWSGHAVHGGRLGELPLRRFV